MLLWIVWTDVGVEGAPCEVLDKISKDDHFHQLAPWSLEDLSIKNTIVFCVFLMVQENGELE